MAITHRVCVASDEIDGFTEACLSAGWAVLDTGERIATDDGEDAEAILLVTVFPQQKASRTVAVSL